MTKIFSINGKGMINEDVVEIINLGDGDFKGFKGVWT